MITIPPVPEWFKPQIEPQPVRPVAREILSPRHLEQYRQYCREEIDKDRLDPEVLLFIREEDSFGERYRAWLRVYDVQRVIQWPAHFLSTQSLAIRIPPLAAVIAAGLAANRQEFDPDVIAHEACEIARTILAEAARE